MVDGRDGFVFYLGFFFGFLCESTVHSCAILEYFLWLSIVRVACWLAIPVYRNYIELAQLEVY